MSSGAWAFAMTAVVLPLLLAEFGDWCPWLAEHLVRWSARMLGNPAARLRYEEEWAANLNEVPGKLSRLAAAIGYVMSIPRMRWNLRNAVAPLNEPAYATLTSAMDLKVGSDMLERALTHRSFAIENGSLPTSEQLEFIGDSVLVMVATPTGPR